MSKTFVKCDCGKFVKFIGTTTHPRWECKSCGILNNMEVNYYPEEESYDW
jgi:hypothetical protein